MKVLMCSLGSTFNFARNRGVGKRGAIVLNIKRDCLFLKPCMPVFRKRGVMREDLLIEAQTGEPAPRQMHAVPPPVCVRW